MSELERLLKAPDQMIGKEEWQKGGNHPCTPKQATYWIDF